MVPVAFWYFSIIGGLMLLAYAIYRLDPVFILGQALGVSLYAETCWLMKREHCMIRRFEGAGWISPPSHWSLR